MDRQGANTVVGFTRDGRITLWSECSTCEHVDGLPSG